MLTTAILVFYFLVAWIIARATEQVAAREPRSEGLGIRLAGFALWLVWTAVALGALLLTENLRLAG